MIDIDIRMNGERIAAARITSISQLADISNYEVKTGEVGFPDAGLPAGAADFTLHNQPRLKSVWSLIAAVAQRAASIRAESQTGANDAG